MWPILIFGLAGMGVAALFAWRRERLLLGCARWLLAALIASGCFGVCVDLQAVLHYSTGGLDAKQAAPGAVSPEQRAYIVLEGSEEALNCLSSAFLFSAMIASFLALGSWPRPSVQPSASTETRAPARTHAI